MVEKMHELRSDELYIEGTAILNKLGVYVEE
jgi:hypothetical protein